MRAAPALFVVAAVLRCSAQTPADTQYEGSLGPAYYSGGYLLTWDAPAYTHVSVFGPDAKPAYSSDLKASGDHRYYVWAVDSDGVAARAYTSGVADKPEAGIELLDLTGKPTQVINTGAYQAQHMVFASDHTLWTVGYESQYEGRADDFNVLRHYSRMGQEISRALPWQKMAGDYNAYTSLQLCIGGKQLFIGNERLGFLAHLHEGGGTWIEMSPQGDVLGEYNLGRYREVSYEPLAMTATGSVYARIWKEGKFDGWAVLERSNRTWQKVTGYPKGVMIGSDGDNIIFSRQEGGWTVLRSVGSASLTVTPPVQRSPALTAWAK